MADTYDTNYRISYEGLRKTYNNKSPYSTGDGIVHGFAYTDFALYGAGHIGIMAGIVETTNVAKILQLDTLATDWYHDDAYETYLYYNPYESQQTVSINVGVNSVDLYDAIINTFLATNVSGNISFSIEPDSAVVLVLAPNNGTQTTNGDKLPDYRLADNKRQKATGTDGSSPQNVDTFRDIVVETQLSLGHPQGHL